VVINRGGESRSITSRKVLIMKKILIAVFALLAFAGVSFADAPSLPDGATAYESEIDTNSTATVACNTTSAITIFSHRKMGQRGWNYVLVNKAITGVNAANAELIINILVYNSSGTLLSTHLIDTIVAASCQSFVLPFHKKCVGYDYSITLTGGSGNGAAVNTTGFQVIKFRPTNWSR
jgi:hypothetical protein